MGRFFSVVLFFFSVIVRSQSRIFTGEIIDKATLSKIEGGHITCDGYSAIADKNGGFSITVPGSPGRKKLIFSHVGYSTKSSICYANKRNVIQLDAKAIILDQIVIKPKKSILEQAIENIPINYPMRPVMQKGLIRLHHRVKECDYFFRGDAVVDLYIPTYASTHQKQQIRIQHNERILVEKRKECSGLLVWVGAYAEISDFVFEKPSFISSGKPDNYSYHSKGIIDYNGRRTYILSFVSRKGAKEEGVIYIDSLTKAFSAIERTGYDVRKFPFVPVAIRKCKIEYQLKNGKWYINRVRSHSSYSYNKNSINETIQEFQSLSIDSSGVKPIPYSERIQYMDNVTSILKKDAFGDNYDTLVAKHEIDSSLTVFPIPKRNDSVPLKRRWSKAKLYSLLRAIKPAIVLRNVPIKTDYPFYIPNTVGAEYAFSTCKSLFTRLGFYENYGLGNLKIQYLALSFEKEIVNNINHRPIRIIPHSGFSLLFSKEKERTSSMISINYTLGARVCIEIRRGISFFLDGDCLINLKDTLMPNAAFKGTSLSIGLMSHLKKY